MRKHRMLFLLALTPFMSPGQSYVLDVVNGYGSGTYNAGDTVHVWSSAFYDRSYFDKWTGDTLFMQDPLNWHTKLIMPDHSISIEANIGELPVNAQYLFTEIQGADTLKKVWSGLPGVTPWKGLIWMFHGTNGSGENFFHNNDMLLCVNKLMSLGYAVISLDCEEKTLLQDLNGDGVYRWNYTFDSLINIDLRNVKAIRDTLIRRNVIDATITQLAFGYSAGGAFSSHIATQLGWRLGIAHNSPGVPWVPLGGLTPMLYSMTQNDDHPDVGPEAAIEAQANVNALLARDVCARYRYALAQPLYPERFHRDTSISIALSEAIFHELDQNQILSPTHYLLLKSDEIAQIIVQHPSEWPVFLGLTPAQRTFVADEINETYANHRFNSDLFGSDIRFIESLCAAITTTNEIKDFPLPVYPNPAGAYVMVPNHGQPYVVFDREGRIVCRETAERLDVVALPAGQYFIRCGAACGSFIRL